MRFKVLATASAAAVLMAAGADIASATSRSSNPTGSQTPTTTYTATTSLKPAASLVGDNAGTCALLRSGGVECWGNNSLGALGDGTVVTLWYSQVPVPAKELTGAVSLVGDGIGYCALLQGGGAKCWGNNSFGELGNGAKPNPNTNLGSDVAVSVKGLADAVSLVSTDYGYCALLRSGGAKCWGSNSFDELGHGLGSTAQVSSDVPVTVKGLAGAVSLVGGDDNGSTGSGYTYCATLKSRTAVCWGENGYGELGETAAAKRPRMFP